MARRVAADLALGPAFLFGGILVCVGVRPAGLTANAGMSYYGVHLTTVLPYAVAVTGAAYFLRRALRAVAADLPSPEDVRGTADLLLAMSGGVVLTPYSVDAVFDWAHTLLGIALFCAEIVLAARILAWSGGDGWVAGALAVQFVSGVVAAIYVLPAHGFLIQAQLAFQLAFGLLLARATYVLSGRTEPAYAD